MSIEISIIPNTQEWESDLATFDYSVFVAPQWLEAVAGPGRTPVYLEFSSQTELVGKAAGLKITPDSPRKAHLFLYAFPSLRNTTADTIREVIERLIEFTVGQGLNRLIIRSYDRPIVFESSQPRFTVTTDHEYILDLTPSSQEIERRINRLMRRKIKKARECNAEFLEVQSNDLADNLVLLMENTKSVRLSKGYQDYSYFYLPFLDQEVLHKALINGIARLFYVKVDNILRSMLLVLVYHKRSYALLLGTDNKGYETGIPAFIYFSTINRLKELGIETFSLGRVPKDPSAPGLVFFKTSLGAQEVPCSAGSTNYLNYPYRLLNPFMDLGRKLPDAGVVRAIKKFL